MTVNMNVVEFWDECEIVGLGVKGIPKGSEGPQPTKFVAEALREIFALLRHRSSPTPIVHWRQNRLKAIQAKQLKFQDKNVHVFPDFPPEIAKKRAAYYDVKRLLRPRSDVKYGLRGLTGLRITYNNAENIFDSPAEAMTFVKHCIIPV
ncbi:hypothetical protein DNTS_014984 [Danionella cerebrum]|uniref:Uncharacterized protein n=1 Tax=Danionella cerebrum TaxID=2873325 RepID=A0A553P0N3_9TELE|nr:hypothetical protein DNTS_014984 [Danionella translucida]